MPGRRDDPRARWVYDFNGPNSDLRQEKSKIRLPNLVESVGTDGRFMGAIRPFPGMANETVHGLPTPESGNGKTVDWALTNIVVAKYVAIQKGLSDDVLRGVCFIADNQAQTSRSVYFSYVDSSDASSDIVELEDFSNLPTHLQATTDSDWVAFDITSGPRYIYVSATASDQSGQDGLSPVNRAYWWDFTVTDVEDQLSGFASRQAGICYFDSDGEKDPWDPEEDFDQAPLADRRTVLGINTRCIVSPQVSGTSGQGALRPGLYGLGVVPVSRKHNLRGKLCYGLALLPAVPGVDSPDQTEAVAELIPPDWSWTGPVTWSNTYRLSADTIPSQAVQDIWATLGEPFDVYVQNNDPPGFYRLQKQNFNSVDEDSFQQQWWTWDPSLDHLYVRVRDYDLNVNFNGDTGRILAYYRSGSADHLNLVISLSASDTHSVTTTAFGSDSFGDSCTYWGMPHVDGFAIYRSTGDPTIVSEAQLQRVVGSSMSDVVNRSLVGALHLVEPFIAKSAIDTSSINLSIGFTPGEPLNFTRDYTDDPDLAVAQIPTTYDFFLDDAQEMPRFKRIAYNDGMLVGVTSIFEEANPDINWHESNWIPESLRWSDVAGGYLENFPIQNLYTPRSGERIHTLEPVGDYLFAISNGAIYRLARSGAQVATTVVQSALGGVGRWGATGVGNSLYLVTKTGLKEIDGNTGAMRSLSAVDRVMLDDRDWENDLANVHVEYDGTAGCIILLNTVKEECILLWEATGAVTTLEDCPWDFLVAGPDPETGGPRRALFITSSGQVHCIDAGRDMGRRSMCGCLATEEVLGICSSDSTTTVIDIVTPNSGYPPATGCVGFELYWMDGNLAGNSYTITAVDATTITVEEMPAVPNTFSTFSIAPVVYRVQCPQLTGLDDDFPYNMFERKTVTSMSAAVSNISLSDVHADTLQKLTMGVYRKDTRDTDTENTVDFNETADQMVVKIGNYGSSATQVYPFVECKWADIDFELQALLVRGVMSQSESQSRQS